MPDRFVSLMSDLSVTALSFFWFITWMNIMAFIPIMLSTLYWIPKIKYTVVDKYHGGSWWKWVKSFKDIAKKKQE